MPDNPQPKTLQIRRNAVTINCTSTPAVFVAQEQITWQGGSVMISGIGVSRADALAALEAEFELLKKMVADSVA